MIPWKVLDRAVVPGNALELSLLQHGREFAIRLGPNELMGSSEHGSEAALAELACARLRGRSGCRLLIGGLGLGYTLAAALRELDRDFEGEASVVVAELVPAVVAWNRGPLAELNGRALEDPRVDVRESDVAQVLRGEKAKFDAILLDVDNGPNWVTRSKNDWLYSIVGLRAAFDALKRGGILAVWSVSPDPVFTKRLSQIGFASEAITVRSRGSRGGRRTIWLAERP